MFKTLPEMVTQSIILSYQENSINLISPITDNKLRRSPYTSEVSYKSQNLLAVSNYVI